MRALRGGLALLAVALLPAAAAAQRPVSAETLTDQRPPRRSCTAAREPQALPGLADLADSAGLAAALTGFVRRHALADSGAYALYSVTPGSITGLGLRRLESRLSEAREAELRGILESALRLRGGGGAAFRLRVDLGEEPRVRVGRSVRCPPELNARFRVQSIVTVDGVQPRPVRIRFLTSAEGRIMNVILLGNSGRPQYDRFLQESLVSRQIPPGLVDGEPVEMEHEQVIQFTTRG